MRNWMLICIAAALLCGCAPWIGIEKIEPGMTKAEVVGHMGKPSSASGNSSQEYLWYVPANRFWERYYVQLVDGKVTSYGPLGKQSESTQ